ncbi:MAG: hypothetical protein PHE02_11850 [Lachnospiraceae bacterium]|nr:hypothetical protein [Lachnospiraceae bacterium]
MNDTEKQQLQKLRKRVDRANKIRLALMFIAVFLLVLIYFGNKFYTGVAWFENMVDHTYVFLLFDIFAMLIAVFVKLGFTVSYNKYLKRHKD